MTKIIQRSPNLGLGIRMQRVATAPVVQSASAQSPLPPYWWGWPGTDGARITAIDALWEDAGMAVAETTYWPGVWVAVVEQTASVTWQVAFTPMVWMEDVEAPGGSVLAWTGDVRTTILPPNGELPPPDEIFWPDDVALPDPLSFNGAELPLVNYWAGLVLPMPILIAAGNTLTVVQDPRSVSGSLVAKAVVGGITVGEVTLLLKRVNPIVGV